MVRNAQKVSSTSAEPLHPAAGHGEVVMEVRDLVVEFPIGQGQVAPVVRGVSFDVKRGSVLAVVGESGCGKSQTCLSLLGMTPPPGQAVAGSIMFDSMDLLKMRQSELREVRGARIGMVFQDPLTALNPVMSIGSQMKDVIRAHLKVSKAEARAISIERLNEVGIVDAEERLRDFPHQFSGGQRQRILIATVLALEPEVLVADEPTTALDVTVQAQILNLIMEIAGRRSLAVVLVTHDLSLVAQYADEVAVMYAGQIVEFAETEDLFARSMHPYTRALMSATPRKDAQRGEVLATIPGRPPAPADLPPGCAFEPRCALGAGRRDCQKLEPPLEVVHDTHRSACHYKAEIGAVVAHQGPAEGGAE